MEDEMVLLVPDVLVRVALLVDLVLLAVLLLTDVLVVLVHNGAEDSNDTVSQRHRSSNGWPVNLISSGQEGTPYASEASAASEEHAHDAPIVKPKAPRMRISIAGQAGIN
jgi:hypothetical protein